MAGLGASDMSADGTRDMIGTNPSIFKTQNTYTVAGLLSSTAVAVADINSDTKPDIAVTSPNGVSIALGDGTGGFNFLSPVLAGNSPANLAVGDFNGDAKIDLVVANNSGGNISVLLGNGLGGFSAPSNFTVGSAPVSVAVGDFNRDMKLDVAVANSGSVSVSVLLGNGLGSLGPATNISVGKKPGAVAVADFNRDMNLDVVVTPVGPGVDVMLGTGTGAFGPISSFSAGGLDNPGTSVAVVDFNLDNNIDIAMVTHASQGYQMSILLGTGLGSFGSARNFLAGGDDCCSFAVGDLNLDMKPDIILGTLFSSAVGVFLGDGKGGLGTIRRYYDGGMYVALGDFNKDMKPDLVSITHNVSPNVFIGLNQSP